MGQYGEFLTALLHPLGIYDLTAGSANESELYALGKALDGVGEALETAEREAHIVTAEDVGLRLREALFAKRNAAQTTQQRRDAIIALMQIDNRSLTTEAINRTLRGCGIRAIAAEAEPGHLVVSFPEVAGVPDNFEQIRSVILDIMPCHLETEFFFRYLTWDECRRQAFTWQSIEAAGYIWETFEKAVLPEE